MHTLAGNGDDAAARSVDCRRWFKRATRAAGWCCQEKKGSRCERWYGPNSSNVDRFRAAPMTTASKCNCSRRGKKADSTPKSGLVAGYVQDSPKEKKTEELCLTQEWRCSAYRGVFRRRPRRRGNARFQRAPKRVMPCQEHGWRFSAYRSQFRRRERNGKGQRR